MQNSTPFGKTGIQIRDTNPHSSTTIKPATHVSSLFAINNTLNQSVSVQFQGSVDNVTWFNLGSAIVVTASTGQSIQTITDAWPKLRATATCSVGPASGAFMVWWVGNGTEI